MPKSAAAPGTSVTSRALSVLGAFDAQHPSLTLSDIARRSELPIATCHRLVAELVSWGALHRNAANRYVIGQRLWSLGLLAPVQRTLRSVAAPYMQDVLFATRHVVNLFALEGDRAVLLERMAGTSVGKPVAQVGERMRLHTSAGGKVLLAHADGALFQHVITDLPRETRYSITEPGRLHSELAAVRERGFATTSEEHALGTSGLAVPVFDEAGRVFAALGIVIIGTSRDSERVVPALQVAAAGIARELGPLRTTGASNPQGEAG